MSTGADRALGEFLAEAQEIVETLQSSLLEIERQRSAGRPADPDLVNGCFRAVHSLKGLTGLFGLTRASELAHRLENLLDAIRLGRVDARPATLDVMFEAVELFGAALAAARDGGDLDPHRLIDYLSRLDAAVAAPAAAAAEPEDGFGGWQLEPGLLSVLTEYEEHRLRENIRGGADIFRLGGHFDLMSIERGIEQVKERVKPHGEIVTYLPGGEGNDPSTIELHILVASHEPLVKLAAALEGTTVVVERIPRSERRRMTMPLSGPPAPAPAPPPPPPLHPSTPPPPTPPPTDPSDSDPDASDVTLRSVSQSVRVDIRKLDALMNAVGELGLVHTGLVELLDRLLTQGRDDEAQALRREVRALERRLAELQGGILEVRMVPLRQVFDKLTRVVRKLSRGLGKQIRLDVAGADTELDKLIVEELSDPLMHIIRNAIDHGIESAAERIAAGKPEIGTISVRALQQGNRVIVSVADDGRGIDEQAVARAAISRGLIAAGQTGELGRRELQNLLFLPGMSTRDEATELSGRGVGLDVVKTNISRLSGIIDLTSNPGLGTAVTITLPITLAIIQAVVVRVAGRVYCVPLNSVLESLLLEPGEIKTIEGREVMSLRRQTLRLVRLSDLFKLGGAIRRPGAHAYVVVVGVAQHRLGLVVDELIGQQDVVIKSLGPALAGLRGIAGATELGGRRTSLVLDVPALVEEALARGGSAEAA